MMSTWYEVFEDSEVQYVTRRKVALVTGFMSLLLALTFAAAVYTHLLDVPPLLVIGGLLTLWCGVVAACLLRLRRLRRVVWCVKLSEREIVGYDHARQKTSIDWTQAVQVSLGDDGLLVEGEGGRSLEVPFLFPDFAALSHRIVHYAELYDVPILIGGRPWQQIDVYDLYPFLQEQTSEDQRPGMSGWF